MSEVPSLPSYVDAVLSTQFDECSIAAADTCRLSVEMAKGRSKEQALSIVDETGATIPRLSRTIFMADVGILSPLTHEHTAKIVLETKAQGLDEPARPRLLAIFNDDLAIPIAGFEKRADGQCSYVQLGQEIHEDNLVVTSRDVRSRYVESIRDLLYKGKDLSENSKRLISDLISQEMQRYNDGIEKQLSPALCRLVKSAFELIEGKDKRTILVLGKPGDEPEKREFSMVRLIPTDQIITHGEKHERPIQYYLCADVAKAKRKIIGSRRNNNYEDLLLMAVTRDRVGQVLARFTGSGCLVIDDEGLNPANVRQLYTLRQFIAHMLKLQTDKFTRPNIVGLREAYKADVAKSIAFGTFEEWLKRDYSSNHSVKSAMGFNARYQESIHNSSRAINDLLNVDQRFDEHLGEYSAETDRLIMRLGRMALAGNNNISGVLKDRKVGKTISDVDVFAHVQPTSSSQVQVHISGRPSSQPELNPVTIFLENLFLTSPNALEIARVVEINSIIDDALSKPKYKKNS